MYNRSVKYENTIMTVYGVWIRSASGNTRWNDSFWPTREDAQKRAERVRASMSITNADFLALIAEHKLTDAILDRPQSNTDEPVS